MSMQEKIERALTHAGMSKTDIGKNVFGISQQGISQRIQNGKFTIEELEKMAKAMGAEYHCYFEFPDGKKF